MQLLKNELKHESSPYLLQHADNPVHWQPWSLRALALAKKLDKPILLSIGYSSCHWCHVMAHESFEDHHCAELMNQHYINIKVDREERPDLDKVYQTCYQIMARKGGGWPLTMFLDPNTRIPFFGGTYFPTVPRYGMPSFSELLENLVKIYHSKKPEVIEQTNSLAAVFTKLNDPIKHSKNHAFDDILVTDLFRIIVNQFDSQCGGFGSAPKFPMTARLDFLLCFYHYFKNSKDLTKEAQLAFDMVVFSLKKMSDGGLCDHLNGGFFRYSTDDQWLIPHFEKMLYDNGLMLNTLIDTEHLLQNALFTRTIDQTIHWVESTMKSPCGGYYSAIDADSDDHEGLFYTWDKSELELILNEEEYQIFSICFGLNKEENFDKKWHLVRYYSAEEAAEQLTISTLEAVSLLEDAKSKCLAIRNQRSWPLIDDKILLSWNAIYIKGLLKVGLLRKNQQYLASALSNLDFIAHTLWDGTQLFSSFKPNGHNYSGYLDDYAFLLDTLIYALQVKFRYEDLLFAIKLADILIEQFQDTEHGGFFFTAHTHEKLIYRPLTFSDDALPSGNGIAMKALMELGHLLGHPQYIQASERALKRILPILIQNPEGDYSVVKAGFYHLTPPELVILKGEAVQCNLWHTMVNSVYHPGRLCFNIADSNSEHLQQQLEHYPSYLQNHDKNPLGTTAYICRGLSCLEPIKHLDEFKKQLEITS